VNQFDHHLAGESGEPIVESSTTSGASLTMDDGWALLYGMILVLRTRCYPMAADISVLDGESSSILASENRTRSPRGQPR
jgi:hypothetical protein